MKNEPSCPEGITDAGFDYGLGGWWSLLRLALIGGAIALAFLGFFGSGEPEPLIERTAAATLQIETPQPLRNGMFFETRIRARANRAVEDAVIAVPAELWRDVTINTMLPAPSEESFQQGYFLFHFGPLDAGDELLFKLDGQINPSRHAATDGRVEFRDRDQVLVSALLTIRVLD